MALLQGQNTQIVPAAGKGIALAGPSKNLATTQVQLVQLGANNTQRRQAYQDAC